MIAMPGLVDCHVHTAQQFLRGKLALGKMGELAGADLEALPHSFRKRSGA